MTSFGEWLAIRDVEAAGRTGVKQVRDRDGASVASNTGGSWGARRERAPLAHWGGV